MSWKEIVATTVPGWALLFFVAFAGRAQSTPSNVQPIASAIRAKHYEQALELARQALKTTPKDVRILTLEALALKEHNHCRILLPLADHHSHSAGRDRSSRGWDFAPERIRSLPRREADQPGS
jgi:hypothetical protein